MLLKWVEHITKMLLNSLVIIQSRYSCVLERDMKRIKQSRQHLYEVNMGATVVGTGLNADPEYIEAVVKHLATISELPLVGGEDLVDGLKIRMRN